MRILKTRFGAIWAAIYMSLVIIAIAFVLAINPARIGFAGVYIVILTLPWSIFTVLALDYLRAIDSISNAVKLLIFGAEAIINAFIIYYIGARWEMAGEKESSIGIRRRK